MRLVANLLNRLPQPLRERLIAWRVRYPTTPLTDLPAPVQKEVTQILTSALTDNTPAPAPQPPQTGVITPTPRGRLDTLTTVIGTDLKTGRDVLLPQRAKVHGTYILGENGTGKTNIVKAMAISDTQNGLGLCVIEPHGDLTGEILGAIPRYRQNDTVYIDIEDFEHPFGLSLFEVPEPRTIRTEAAVASFLSHTFEVLWSAGFETPRLMQNLRAVTRTLIANPGSTFADIPALYERVDVRARMLAHVRNPHVLAYWEQYKAMSPRDKRLFTESFLNKVTAFLDEPMIAHILSQPKTTINFRSIMDNSKILLIKLSPQFEEVSRLIGTVIIGKLLMTAFSRTDTPRERRLAFSLYVDEFQRFQSSHFATFISEARKFNISTCLSHQVLSQLTEQVRASALAGGTIICFRVSGDDSRVLCRSFDTTPTQQIVGEEPIRAPVTDVLGHLMRRGHLNPQVAKFTQDYISRLASLETLVSRTIHRTIEFGCCNLPKDYVDLGKRALNAALHECMATQNPAVILPPLPLFIFGGAVNEATTSIFQPHMLYKNYEFNGLAESANFLGHPNLLADEKILALLRKKYARRRFWYSIWEWDYVYPAASFIQFLTALRQVMAILAAEPILVDTGQYRPKLQPRLYSDVEGEIANSLTNQENYHAKVKIVNAGEYTIKTRPAPQGLSGDALTERIEAVKRHCRALGYTRPYTEVIEEIRKRQEHWRGGNESAMPQPPEGTGTQEDVPPPPALF